MKSDKDTGKESSFESALARLEEIVKEMDSGELDLDKMVSHFEEGSKLIKTCSAKLNEVESKIEKIVKRGDELVAEDFEDESAPEVNIGTPSPNV